MTSQTWPCGTPRSTGNAFSWAAAPTPAKAPTPAEINRAKTREAARAKYVPVAQRMALDSKGRALVDMKPRTTNAIAITSRADDMRNQRIKRGTST
jgi:hypothetical protein